MPTCPHGRPTNTTSHWDWIKGVEACEDCAEQDWNLSRKATIIGVLVMTIIIMLPAILILAGTFW